MVEHVKEGGGMLYCYVRLMGWILGCSPYFCGFYSVIYGCGLCGVGFHMGVVKFQDVGWRF